MSLTPTEEAQTRQLIAQNAPLLSLASNEPIITSKLGATKVNLSQLPAASTIADADILLTRQGTADKSVAASVFKTYVSAPAASEAVVGVTRFATDSETQAGTLRTVAVDPGSLSNRTALETRTGIAAIATQSQTDAGTDDTTIVTPKKLRWGFSANLTTNGFIAFPSWLGGPIFQWGLSAQISPDSTLDVTLPITFPNNAFAALTTVNNATFSTQGNYSSYANFQNLSTLRLVVDVNGTPGSFIPQNVFWFVIGR